MCVCVFFLNIFWNQMFLFFLHLAGSNYIFGLFICLSMIGLLFMTVLRVILNTYRWFSFSSLLDSRHDSWARLEQLSTMNRFGKTLMIRGNRNETCDDLTSRKVASVEALRRGHGDRNGRTLDVDVALGCGRIHVDVNNSAVFCTLLDHVVSNVLFPVWFLHLSLKINKLN